MLKITIQFNSNLFYFFVKNNNSILLRHMLKVPWWNGFFERIVRSTRQISEETSHKPNEKPRKLVCEKITWKCKI